MDTSRTHRPDAAPPEGFPLDGSPLEGLPLDRLDAALSRALPAPLLPAGFHERLQAACLREQAEHWRQTLVQRRQELLALHERERTQLRNSHVRLRLQTLATVAGLSFALGAMATAALPWLQAQAGLQPSVLMPLLAAGLGAVVGLGAWLGRAGKLRWEGLL